MYQPQDEYNRKSLQRTYCNGHTARLLKTTESLSHDRAVLYTKDKGCNNCKIQTISKEATAVIHPLISILNHMD